MFITIVTNTFVLFDYGCCMVAIWMEMSFCGPVLAQRNLYGLRVNLFKGHPNRTYRCRLEVDGKVHALVKLVRCVGIIHFVFHVLQL